MNYKLIVGAILIGLAVVFTIQNVTVTDLRFLFWTLTMSRAVLMFLILAIGIILGWLLHGSFIKRKNNKLAKRDPVTGPEMA